VSVDVGTDVLDGAGLLPWLEDDATQSAGLLVRAQFLTFEVTPLVPRLQPHDRLVRRVRRWTLGVPAEHQCVTACRDLAGWLNIAATAVPALVGLADSTYHWWRTHPDATVRPGKAGRLLRLHSLLELLVSHLGADQARAWMVQHALPGRVLDEDGLRALEADGYALLRPSGPAELRPVTDPAVWAEVLQEASAAEQVQILRESPVLGALPATPEGGPSEADGGAARP
jgi:hypothetical protein